MKFFLRNDARLVESYQAKMAVILPRKKRGRISRNGADKSMLLSRNRLDYIRWNFRLSNWNRDEYHRDVAIPWDYEIGSVRKYTKSALGHPSQVRPWENIGIQIVAGKILKYLRVRY